MNPYAPIRSALAKELTTRSLAQRFACRLAQQQSDNEEQAEADQDIAENA